MTRLALDVDDLGVGSAIGERFLARADDDHFAILDRQRLRELEPVGDGHHFTAGEDDVGMRVPRACGQLAWVCRKAVRTAQQSAMTRAAQ